MLINKSKTYDAGEIVAFKLVTGDEIVAKVVEQGGLEFTIQKPLTVVMANKGIVLVPSIYTGQLDRDVNISNSQIIMHTPVAKDVKDYIASPDSK